MLAGFHIKNCSVFLRPNEGGNPNPTENAKSECPYKDGYSRVNSPSPYCRKKRQGIKCVEEKQDQEHREQRAQPAWKVLCIVPTRIHVRRAKNGVDSTHPLTGKEIRALRQLRRENLQSRFVFNTERSGPVTRAWFLKMVRRTGELAKLLFPIHPHMLRHACGFKLANDGVDTRALQHFLGHRNIMHTVRYTELRSDRFDGFWKG